MSGAAGADAGATRLLRAVFAATFFVRFAFGLTVAVFASYIQGRSDLLLSESVGLVGTVSALAPVGEFSTVLLSGSAADRYGRFPVLFGGIGLATIAFVGVALTRVPWQLGALNFLFGVGSGAILAASLAVIADRAERDHRGLEMGRFDAVNLLGWIGGFAVGFGLLGAVPNRDLGFLFLAGAALLVGGLGVAWVVRGDHRERAGRPIGGQWRAIGLAVVRRDVMLVVLPWLVIYLLIGTAFVFLGNAATGAGVPTWELALGIGVGGCLLLLTQPTYGRFADRFGRSRLMRIGTVGFVGVLVAAALLATYGVRPELIGLLGVSALAALAYGPAALAALADLSRALTRATTMALYTLVISLGMLLGLLVSTNLFSAFGIPGLDAFLGAVGAGLVALTLAREWDERHAPIGRPAPA